MAEHSASVIVDAPVHQVYELFTHFNDFPKFMSFVKEVTYKDDETSHWVADVVGRHEWDAVNENWIPDQQIGWRSIDGLQNSGRVTFQPQGNEQTLLTVLISYNPPAGFLGDIGEVLGSGKRFENALQHDLDNFAKMVAEAPPGALDPMPSDYLFHGGSAAAKGQTTQRQDSTMDQSTGAKTAEGNTNWQDTPGNAAAGGARVYPSTPNSAAGYDTGTSAASTDSVPTTGTATSWSANQPAGSVNDAKTTVGQAAEIANLDNPITVEEQEEAVGIESASVRPVDDDI